MFGGYAGHDIIRKTCVIFGNLFKNVVIRRTSMEDGSAVQTLLVPIAYGPRQSYFVRNLENPDLAKKTEISLPRMSFQIVDIEYDPERKINTLQKITSVNPDDPNSFRQTFAPVPYTIYFELYFYAKNSSDVFNFYENILVFFTPSLTVRTKLIPELGINQDIPFSLLSVDTQDNFTEEFIEQRRIIATLKFSAKINLYGPVSKSGIIKHVIIDESIDMNEPFERKLNVMVEPLSANKDDPYTISSNWEDIPPFES